MAEFDRQIETVMICSLVSYVFSLHTSLTNDVGCSHHVSVNITKTEIDQQRFTIQLGCDRI